MKLLNIIIVLSLFTLMACQDPLGVEDNVRKTPIIGQGMIKLDSLAVGQKARFIFYEIITDDVPLKSPESCTLHVGDTLVMEVFGKDAGGWLFREYIISQTNTVDSILRLESQKFDREDTIEYHVNIVDNKFVATMADRTGFVSFLFFSGSAVSISLDDYSDTLVTMDYWSSPFARYSQYSKGYMVNYRFHDKTFDRINILLNDFTTTYDFASEYSRQLLIFSKKYGFTRNVQFFSAKDRESIGYGWDLIYE